MAKEPTHPDTASTTQHRVAVALSSPYLALSAAALFWAGNFIVGRAMRGEISPVTLSFWRWAVALAILLPLGYSELRAHLWHLRRAWVQIAILGLTGIALFQLFLYTGLTTTTALNALLLVQLSPATIALAAWLVLGEPLTRYRLLGIGLSLIGALVLITQGNPAALRQLTLNVGDIWILGSVLVWAIYTILLRRLPVQLPQLALLTSTTIAGVLWLLPLYLWRLSLGDQLEVNPTNVLGILYIAIFASVLAYLFWNRGVEQIGPSRTGLFIHLMPVFGVALSYLLLGEQIWWYHLAGAALIFAGIVVMRRD